MITQNVEALTGSPVLVQITQISPGSVDVGTSVVFMDGSISSASDYQSVMTSGNTDSIFGANFGVVNVDASSVTASSVSNPSKTTSMSALAVNHDQWCVSQ